MQCHICFMGVYYWTICRLSTKLHCSWVWFIIKMPWNQNRNSHNIDEWSHNYIINILGFPALVRCYIIIVLHCSLGNPFALLQFTNKNMRIHPPCRKVTIKFDVCCISRKHTWLTLLNPITVCFDSVRYNMAENLSVCLGWAVTHLYAQITNWGQFMHVWVGEVYQEKVHSDRPMCHSLIWCTYSTCHGPNLIIASVGMFFEQQKSWNIMTLTCYIH